MKATLTEAEYLQLVGLLTLSAKMNREQRAIVDAVREILGEDDNLGHASDMVYQAGEGGQHDPLPNVKYDLTQRGFAVADE